MNWNKQGIDNSEYLSRNAAGEESVTGTSVNGKYDVKVINMFVVPIKISNANLKNTFMAYATLDNFSQGVP